MGIARAHLDGAEWSIRSLERWMLMREPRRMMNWGVLGQATGWLPGAVPGTLIGGLGSILVWEDFAHDQCQLGTSTLTQACGHLAGLEVTSSAGFVAAAAAIGGIVGAAVSLLIAALNETAADS
jgi:hypothetical protein